MSFVTRTDLLREQPPATVNQMAPAPEPVDPRLVAQVMQQMQVQNQPTMSHSDGIYREAYGDDAPTVATNYMDAYTQQAEQFSHSPLGQSQLYGNSYQNVAADERANYLIRHRAAEILSNTLYPGSDFQLNGHQYFG